MKRPLMVILSASLWSCDVIDPDDASEEEWVLQTIRMLHGQNARSGTQVDALTELSLSATTRAEGRKLVFDVLVNDPAYTEYWSLVVAEMLAPARAGLQRQPELCWDEPSLDPMWYPDLVEHMTWADADEAFCVRHTPGNEIWLPTGPNRPAVPAGQIVRRTTPAVEDPASHLWAGIEDDPVEDPVTRVSDDRVLVEDTGPVDPVADASTLFEQPAMIRISAGGDGLRHGAGEINPEMDDVLLEFTIDEVDLPPVKTPSYEVCYPFTMYDALAAAVSEDDLFGFLRMAVIPLHSHYLVELDEGDRRSDFANKFLATYTGRDGACLECHNASYATTDPRPRNFDWDRHYPLSWDLDASAFSRIDEGEWVHGGTGVGLTSAVAGYFRSDQFEPFDDDVDPFETQSVFGLHPDCAPRLVELGPDPEGDRTGIAGEAQRDDVGLVELTRLLRDGATHAFETGESIPDTTSEEPCDGEGETVASKCMGCHSEGADWRTSADPPESQLPTIVTAPSWDDLQVILSTINDVTLLEILEDGSRTGGMSSRVSALTSDTCSIERFVANIRDEVPYSPPPMLDRGDTALVTLVASRVVSGVVEELSGQPLLLEHGFARNASQQDVHETLLTTYMGSGWSLQTLLEEIVLSPLVGRLNPEQSTEDYPLPLLTNPWADPGPGYVWADPPVEHPPLTPEQSGNGIGDLLMRHSPNRLVYALSEALWWPQPRVHGGTTAFPTADQMNDIGRMMSGITHQRPTSLDTTLAWEALVDGCEKPLEVYAGQVLPIDPTTEPSEILAPEEWIDWIDAVLDAGMIDDATLLQAVVTVKERLVSSTSIELWQEQDTLLDLFGVESLDTPLDRAAHETGLRTYCAVLTMTPQFQMGGMVAPSPSSKGSPSAEPICVEPPCSVEGYLADYEELLDEL